jgi:hypothetical protein
MRVLPLSTVLLGWKARFKCGKRKIDAMIKKNHGE